MKRAFWQVDPAVVPMAVVTVWELWRQGEAAAHLWPVAVAILLHEVAHVVMAAWRGVKICGIRLGLTGARLEMEGLLSYGDEWLIAAAGPTVNLLSAAFSYPVWRMRGQDASLSDGWWVFLGSSVVLGMVNLCPVVTLDGGRMLSCALAKWMGADRGETILRGISAVCLWTIWLGAGYILLRTGELLTLWVFATCLLTGQEIGLSKNQK